MTVMTENRTDPHRPSAIVPEDYIYVGCKVKIEGLQDVEFMIAEREKIKAHFEKTGGKWYFENWSRGCNVCGSTKLIYDQVFHHWPTNTYVRMGEDCACNLDSGGFELFKAKIADAMLRNGGKKKAEAYLNSIGMGKVWEIFDMYEVDSPVLYDLGEIKIVNEQRVASWDLTTLVDIVNKLIQYGTLSDAQLAFLPKLARCVEDRKTVEAEKAAADAIDRENSADCPAGRVAIDGTVVSTKVDDGLYGAQLKMLVRDASGFKVYGTVPSSLLDIQHENGYRTVVRGDHVTFVASVEPGKKDTKFGIFKRPAKAVCHTAEDKSLVEEFYKRKRMM
jgi:hypothetical protein